MSLLEQRGRIDLSVLVIINWERPSSMKAVMCKLKKIITYERMVRIKKSSKTPADQNKCDLTESLIMYLKWLWFLLNIMKEKWKIYYIIHVRNYLNLWSGNKLWYYINWVTTMVCHLSFFSLKFWSNCSSTDFLKRKNNQEFCIDILFSSGNRLLMKYKTIRKNQ